ncbi:hypothetical protein C6501_09070 [Candidatus Poribacteria bacterium]|nr:MAG: hypothetical protein C6501_09070 [Candidatus Poribacteria bacterium]
MNLIEVIKHFPDQESCIAFLENIRWGNTPICAHCGSLKVNNRHEKKEGLIGRWNCQDCKASFKVTCNTLFHGTKIPLQKWFAAISLMINAKKSLSSHQLARDLELNQKTAWYMMQKIRAEMAVKGNTLLKGIIEADETYIGGKPRKGNKRADDEPVKRGRGTSKTPVIGAVERGGHVIAKVADDLTGQSIMRFIKDVASIEDSELMTDEFKGYLAIGREMKHHIINHKEQYVDGDVHTNTIEGFWSLLKRAWYGTHHHYSVAWMPLYVAEACYKYNYRDHDDVFWKFLRESMSINT